VPEVFGSDEKGHSVLKVAEIPDDLQLQSDVSWAVSACPTGALSIIDD
jgi:ferredoxin